MDLDLDDSLFGRCDPPFYDTTLPAFNDTHVYTEGRVCADSGCCLPCPTTQFMFPKKSVVAVTATAGCNTVSFFFVTYLLLSYAVLPKEFTRRTFAKASLITALGFVNFGFILPLGANSSMEGEDTTVICADPVTPNDMHTSAVCALSGLSIVLGTLAVSTWLLICCILLHLELCWQKPINQIWGPILRLVGWAIPIGIAMGTVAFTGVSFRIGPGACNINHPHSLASYWIWIVLMCAASAVIFVGTVLWGVVLTITTSLAGKQEISIYREPSSSPALLRELKKVAKAQFRLMLMVVGVLIAAVAFVVVFFRLDAGTSDANVKAIPWFLCLVKNPYNPSPCFTDAQDFLVRPGTLDGIFLYWSVLGILSSGAFHHMSFFTGWKILFQTLFTKNGRSSGQQQHDMRHLRGLSSSGGRHSPQTIIELPQIYDANNKRYIPA